MGKANNGILGAVSGKVGNLIFYVQSGQACVRTAGKRYAALTPAEQINTGKMSLLMNFFRPIKPFLKLGFGCFDSHNKLNYHNRATAYNKTNAIDLVHGNPQIAFNRVLLSQGTGLPAENADVKMVEGALQYSWTYDPEQDWQAGMDQVMLMAYFPDENCAVYELAGAKRAACAAVLQLPNSYLGKRMEVFIAFASWDRERIADSVYLGRIN
jgi:hypothetical protein